MLRNVYTIYFAEKCLQYVPAYSAGWLPSAVLPFLLKPYPRSAPSNFSTFSAVQTVNWKLIITDHDDHVGSIRTNQIQFGEGYNWGCSG